MTTPIEQTMVSIAAPIVAGGLHPNIAPQNSVRPYGVYLNIISPTQNTLADGVRIIQDIFQVDIWDVTYAGAKTTGDAFAAAMQALFDAGTITGVNRSARGRYDLDTRLHGFTYEFSFWYH